MGLRSMVTTFWGMASLLLPLMIYRVSRSESTPAYYAAVSLGVAAVCQVGTGLWRDRCGRFWPLLISTAAVGVSGLGLGLFWQSLACLFAFGTALTSAAWAVSTLMPALINEVAGPEEKNRLVGLGHTVWSGSMVLGNLLGGILIEVRPGLPFYAGAALAAGAVVCGWRLGMHLDRPGA
jgi:MFS family permease